MEYIALSVTDFSSTRREVRVLHHFSTIIFIGIMFFQESFWCSIWCPKQIYFYSLALDSNQLCVLSYIWSKKNTHLFVITGSDAFLENNSYYKAIKSCETKHILTYCQLFQKKPALNFWKFETANACTFFVPGISSYQGLM